MSHPQLRDDRASVGKKGFLSEDEQKAITFLACCQVPQFDLITWREPQEQPESIAFRVQGRFSSAGLGVPRPTRCTWLSGRGKGKLLEGTCLKMGINSSPPPPGWSWLFQQRTHRFFNTFSWNGLHVMFMTLLIHFLSTEKLPFGAIMRT